VESIARVLPSLLRELGLEAGVLGWRAVEAWPELVGPRVARHARAVAFRDGTLQVEVEGSAWMQELGYLKRDLVRRINQHLGAEDVRDVRFTLPHGGRPR